MSNKQNRLPLEKKFRYDLTEGKAVVAAVSGGADSMALLHLLWQHGAAVFAAHLNHCLRGAESDRDEAFVRDFCRERGIPFFSKRVEIAVLSRRDGLGEEECGRRERYAFLEEVRRELPGDAVAATAHTLSDQLETILFRLARGTGLDGLCGIPYQREGVIRPLLDCTRADIEDYCRRKGVPYITDSTNTDPHYARNRIRMEVVPALKQVNAGVELHAGQLVQSLSRDASYLESQADTLLRQARTREGLDAARIYTAHPAVAVRAVARFLTENRIPSDYALLTRLIALAGRPRGTVNLPGGQRAVVDNGELVLASEPGHGRNWQAVVLLPPDPVFGEPLANLELPDGRNLQCIPETSENFQKRKKIYNSDLIFSLDYDTIVERLSFRCRSAGDRLCLKGRPGSRLLKKLYSEMGLSQRQRQEAAVAVDEQGTVWAEYAGADERALPSGATSRLLLLVVTARKETENHDEK